MELDDVIRIVICEENALFRGVLRSALEEPAGLVVVGETATGEELILMLAGGVGVDVVITDLLMPGIDGWETARRIRAAHPDLPVMILTSYDRPGYLERAREAGARGYFPSGAGLDDLIDSIRILAAGGTSLGP